MSPATVSRARRTAQNRAGRRLHAVLSVLSLVAGPEIAGAQGTVASPDVESRKAIETVEVQGNRETVLKAAVAFVTSLTRTDGDDLARWRLPICPVVFGVSSEQNHFVRQRILAVAENAGAPRSVKADCRPNLLVVFSDQPEEMLTTLRKRKLELIGTGLPKDVDGATPAMPVRVWRSSTLNNADGTGPRVTVDTVVPVFRAEDSRLVSGVAENIGAVVVMVDTTRTGMATFGQLADFVAMVSLARADLNANLASFTTILRLFTPSLEAVPPGLTDLDRAFLKGLYESRDVLLHQRSQIASSMARDLVP